MHAREGAQSVVGGTTFLLGTFLLVQVVAALTKIGKALRSLFPVRPLIISRTMDTLPLVGDAKLSGLTIMAICWGLIWVHHL
jgi:hypothetical protein